MTDVDKTKEQVTSKLAGSRQRVAELEASETKRKQAEIILAGSDDYQRLFELSPLGIVVLDMKGVITACNSAVYMKSGYSKEDFIGKHFSKVATIRAKDIPKFIKTFASLIRGKVPKPFEVIYTRKDGTTGWTEAHISLVKSGGKKVGIQVIQQDITERKQAEEALRESEKQASAAIEAARALTFNYDIATGKIGWGGAIEEITGYTREEFAKVDIEGWAERIHPDDRDEILSILQEAMRKDRATAEYRFKTKKDYITLSSISLTEKQHGKAVGLVGILQDITERKQVEEALRESEEKLRNMFDSVTDGITVTDLNGTITECNDITVKIHGFDSKDKVLGKSAFEFIAPLDHERATANMQRTLEKGTIQGIEYILLKADGSNFPGELSASVLRDESGNPLGFIALTRDITERKQAEEALRESEERYRALVSLGGKLGEAIIMMQDNEQGDVMPTFFNEEWPRITGYSGRELLGMSFFDLVHPKDRAASLKRHKRKMNGEIIPGLFEMRIIRKDGTEVPIELTSAYTTYQGQGATVAFIRDITERKQAEEEISGLAKFPSENPNPVLRIAKDGTVLYANNASLPLLGVWGCQVGQLLPDYLSQSILDVLGSSLHKYIEVECGERTFSFMFAPIADSGYVNLYGRDITERKQAEEELVQLRKAVEASGEVIFLTARDGIITFVNPEFTRLYGYSAAEVVGKATPRVLKSGVMKQEDYEGFWETLLNKQTVRGELVNKTKDGRLITIEGSANPILDEQGNIIGFLAIQRDITERKQAEEREKQLREELNLSSRLASIGELAAGVAHEINNPLTGIIGFSQRLLRKSVDEEIKRDLKRINDEALRAAKVVENLRTFARRRQPNKECVDINEILGRTLELRTYELRTSNIELVVELAPDLPRSMVDSQQIGQVFLNIILNAEQAMIEANSGGKLVIKTELTKDYVRISFADDGPGISAENLGKLFDPFFTTRGEKGGTGLGLSVCHGIVTEHGGRIYVKSKPGKGAAFFVELPLATAKVDKSKAVEEKPLSRSK